MDDAGEGSRVADGRDPTWQLRVPDKGVTADIHAVGLGIVDEGGSSSKVEVVLAGFNTIPLHAVLRSELIELSLDDGDVLGVGEETRVGASAKVFFTLGYDTTSQTIGRWVRRGGGGRSRDRRVGCGGRDWGRCRCRRGCSDRWRSCCSPPQAL